MPRFLAVLTLMAGFSVADSAVAAPTKVTDAQGITYQLPDGWKATTRRGGGLFLTAPSATDAESYLAMRWGFGFTKADRLKIRARLTQLMSKTLPHLKFVEDAWMQGPQGAVAILSYKGNNQAGVEQKSQLYIASMGQHTIALMAAGNTRLIDARAQACRLIFLSAIANAALKANQKQPVAQQNTQPVQKQQPLRNTATAPAGVIDPKLVGAWVCRRARGSAGAYASVASQSRFTLTFKADGTCTLQTSAWVSGSTSSSSAISRTRNPTIYTGRWATSNGKLAINYSDGSTMRKNYTVFPHLGHKALKLFLPNGGKPVYYHGQ